MDNHTSAPRSAKFLGQISEDEVADGRPMLSAIVVSRDTTLPGHGFFNLGQELRQTDADEDEMGFAVRQILRVHEYWRGGGEITEFERLIAKVRAIPLGDRIEFRDQLVALGPEIIPQMSALLLEPGFGGLAISIFERLASGAGRDAASPRFEMAGIRYPGAALNSTRRWDGLAQPTGRRPSRRGRVRILTSMRCHRFRKGREPNGKAFRRMSSGGSPTPSGDHTTAR